MALTLVTSDLIHGLDYSKLTGTIPTWNQDTTGNAATSTLAAGATILATARNIGGVSFNGSAAIDLPGVNTAGNQPTSGNAGTVTNGVYTVGDQTIAGVKTFSGEVIINPSANRKISFKDNNNVFKAGIQAVNSAGQMAGTSEVDELIIRSQLGMRFATGGNTERFRITSSGAATFNGGVTISGANNTASKLILTNTASSNTWSFNPEYNSQNFTISEDANPRITLKSGGNVGIGTTSPGAKLEVEGEALFGSGTDGIKISYSGGNSTGIIDTGYDSTGLEFRVANSEKMCITSGGVVEIGGISVVTPALLSVRKNGTCIEYGHGNNNGRYEGTLGAFGSAGYPYIGFSTSCDNSANTFTTRGWKGNVINSNDQGDLIFSQATNANAGTQTLAERMRISSAGNVGIGMAPSTDAKLEILNGNIRVRGSSANSIMLSTTAGATRAALGNYGNEGDLSLWRSNNAKYIYLSSYYDSYINPGGGSLFIGGTTNLGYNSHNVQKSAASSYALIVRNSDTSTTNNSVFQFNRAETTATTGGYCSIYRQGSPSTGTNRWIVYANGNITNTNNSYGSLSDERKKENIVDATPKLDKLMEVKVRNFNLIGEETKQIGVVAQELEEVFPGMISESKDPDSEDETLYKSVKYSVFVPILIKAIQELKAQIELLKQEVELLKQ